MTIYFDKNCVYWSNDDKMNEHFLNCQADYIRELVRNRGYIYLNQIYEILGAKWEPRYDNQCIENADFTIVVGLDCIHSRWVVDIF